MRLPRSYGRLAWIALANGLAIVGLAAGGFGLNNVLMITALLAGIALELGGSSWAATFNVGAFLFVPVGWVWERIHDAYAAEYAGEYGLTLILVALPSLILAVVNSILYVSAARKTRKNGAQLISGPFPYFGESPMTESSRA